MIAPGEIVGSVYGAWRLARRDPSGLIWMDPSRRGVWHSFWGPALVAPGFLVMQALDGVFETEQLRPLVVELIAYVIGCVAFPLAMAHLSEGLGRTHLYTRFVVAYNWSAVIQMALLLPASLLMHLVPGDAFAMLNLAVSILLLVYQAYIAHVALAVAPGTAAMLIFLDLLIGAMIQMAADHLLG
jgi:hypothetical protein